MENLRKLLIEYKEVSQEMIRDLNNENYDNLNEHLIKRQNIIDFISSNKYEHAIFIKINEEINLTTVEQNLNHLMVEKFNKTKIELKKIAIEKSVNNNYNNTGYVDSIYFNKKT